MTFSFIIPLAIVLLAVYIFKNSADEMAYLSASIAGVALLVALILVPWQLKLVLLSIVALTSVKLWFPSKELKIGNSSSSSNSLTENFQLELKETENLPSDLFNPLVKGSYRGVSYEHNVSAISAKLSEVKLNGKYRGQAWQSSQLENPTPVQPNFEIKYRGATVNSPKPLNVETEQKKPEKINLISIVPK